MNNHCVNDVQSCVDLAGDIDITTIVLGPFYFMVIVATYTGVLRCVYKSVIIFKVHDYVLQTYIDIMLTGD